MARMHPTQISTGRHFWKENTHSIMLLVQSKTPQQTQACSALVGSRGAEEGCAGVPHMTHAPAAQKPTLDITLLSIHCDLLKCAKKHCQSPLVLGRVF
jgi:hypothetical protein